MKKSKFAIVIALGLVLCLLCGVTTTFSWFSRPRTESGDSLRWSGQYKISNGQNISIKTVESSDDGSTFGENAVTNFGGSLEAGKRRYFAPKFLTRAMPNRMFRFYKRSENKRYGICVGTLCRRQQTAQDI